MSETSADRRPGHIGYMRVTEAVNGTIHPMSANAFTTIVLHTVDIQKVFRNFYSNDRPYQILFKDESKAHVIKGQRFLHQISVSHHLFSEIEPLTEEGQKEALDRLNERVEQHFKEDLVKLMALPLQRR